MADSREAYGRIVRAIWVDWASEQPDPKPSWLTGWNELDDGQREVDMRIGSAVAAQAKADAGLDIGELAMARARLGAARAVVAAFLEHYGHSDLPMFKPAIDLANSLRKILPGGEEAAGPLPGAGS